MQIQIKCHRANRAYSSPHFFVLSKGQNAGKPLHQPCPNCFVITANNQMQRDQLFWLSFGLWQTRHFWPYLNGSVIPFIHVGDLRHILRESWMRMYTNPDPFLRAVKSLNDIIALQKQLNDQLAATQHLKCEIIRKAVRFAHD